MTRIAAAISYCGKAYHGWQAQDGLDTVQGRVEEALSFVAAHPVKVVCAGRTDAGVHACEQVIHFDTDAERSDYSWQFGANSHLPNDIRVMWLQPVPEDFHARFSAEKRMYRYILDNQAIMDPILRDLATYDHREINMQWLKKAAKILVGKHDFTSFRAADCQAKSPVRDLEHFEIKRQGDFIIFELRANAFLHHMVRNIVGTLMEVAVGRKSPQWVQTVLDAKERRMAGATAAPTGLYLVGIDYPRHFQLPRTEPGPRFITL